MIHRKKALRFITALMTVIMHSLLPVSADSSEVQWQQARTLAEAHPWPQRQSRTSAEHPLGVQLLSVEQHEQKARPSPTVRRVYQYNYNRQHARLLIVDLSSDQLISEHLIESAHLPLNEAEQRFALQLLAERDDLITALKAEHARSGRTVFDELASLDVKASIYEPLDSTRACARQRCALLSLFDDSRTVFSIEPVVNLDTQTVELLQPR